MTKLRTKLQLRTVGESGISMDMEVRKGTCLISLMVHIVKFIPVDLVDARERVTKAIDDQLPNCKAEFSSGVLFIYGERECGKTYHSEALRKFFRKEFVIEGHQSKLPDSCIVMIYGPSVVDEDQDVLSFTQAMSIAGIVSTEPITKEEYSKLQLEWENIELTPDEIDGVGRMSEIEQILSDSPWVFDIGSNSVVLAKDKARTGEGLPWTIAADKS